MVVLRTPDLASLCVRRPIEHERVHRTWNSPALPTLSRSFLFGSSGPSVHVFDRNVLIIFCQLAQWRGEFWYLGFVHRRLFFTLWFARSLFISFSFSICFCRSCGRGNGTGNPSSLVAIALVRSCWCGWRASKIWRIGLLLTQ